MDQNSPPNRCRLILVAIFQENAATVDQVEAALGAGDVATIIVSGPEDAAGFQVFCENIVEIAHLRGVAVMIANDTRAMGRSKADGVHIDHGNEAIRDAVEKFSPEWMVGAGGLKTRHNALVVGEMQPDYVFFGKLDGDVRPEPHPKNLALAEWWSSMVEIPCVVMGGSDPASALMVAQTGAEFVALSSAIFSRDSPTSESAAQAVRGINQMLDSDAPRFDEE